MNYARLYMIGMRPLISMAKVCMQAICITTLAFSSAIASKDIHGTVTRVTDGDTFHLSDIEPAIRVWGLNAPEWDERGGSTATRTMHNLIYQQKLKCIVKDMDRYRRIVGQCFLPDGRDIAKAMIAAGVATEYCRYSHGFYGSC